MHRMLTILAAFVFPMVGLTLCILVVPALLRKARQRRAPPCFLTATLLLQASGTAGLWAAVYTVQHVVDAWFPVIQSLLALLALFWSIPVLWLALSSLFGRQSSHLLPPGVAAVCATSSYVVVVLGLILCLNIPRLMQSPYEEFGTSSGVLRETEWCYLILQGSDHDRLDEDIWSHSDDVCVVLHQGEYSVLDFNLPPTWSRKLRVTLRRQDGTEDTLKLPFSYGIYVLENRILKDFDPSSAPDSIISALRARSHGRTSKRLEAFLQAQESEAGKYTNGVGAARAIE